jgi:hypothetical protein
VDEVSTRVTRILDVNTLDLARTASTPYRAYFDAVTRAATDKGRRAEREEIMYSAILSAENGETAERWERSFPEEAVDIVEAQTED